MQTSGSLMYIPVLSYWQKDTDCNRQIAMYLWLGSTSNTVWSSKQATKQSWWGAIMHQHMPIHANKYICKESGLHAPCMSCKLKLYSRNGHCMAKTASRQSCPWRKAMLLLLWSSLWVMSVYCIRHTLCPRLHGPSILLRLAVGLI